MSYSDRAYYGLCILVKIYSVIYFRSATLLATTTVSVAIRVNRVMFASLCAETIKHVFEGTKSDSCGRK